MELTFQPITTSQVFAISHWRYESPYSIYNMDYPPPTEDVAYWLDPTFNVHAILDKHNVLVAFCSFGPDGQVLGGDYSRDALDLGMGVRPDLTGQGKGRFFSKAVCEYACKTFSPHVLRVTVASMNKRAQRVWSNNGFLPVSHFVAERANMPFEILIKELSI